MANKARYIGSTQTDKNYLEMMFEYRGKTYFVTRPLSWTACSSDYTMGGKTEKQQHQEAQKLIDDSLDAPKAEIKPALWTEEYENEIWDMLGFDK